MPNAVGHLGKQSQLFLAHQLILRGQQLPGALRHLCFQFLVQLACRLFCRFAPLDFLAEFIEQHRQQTHDEQGIQEGSDDAREFQFGVEASVPQHVDGQDDHDRDDDCRDDEQDGNLDRFQSEQPGDQVSHGLFHGCELISQHASFPFHKSPGE